MVTYTVTIQGGENPDPQAMGKAMRKVQLILLAGEDKIFAVEGPNWAPLAETTIKRRRKGRASFGGIGVRILRDKGLLYGSMTALSHPSGIRDVSDTEAVVGTRVPYGGAHQDGVPRKNLPQRKFARIREEDLPLIDNAVADGFMSSLGRSA